MNHHVVIWWLLRSVEVESSWSLSNDVILWRFVSVIQWHVGLVHFFWLHVPPGFPLSTTEKNTQMWTIYICICTMDVFHQQSCHYRIRIQWTNIPKEHDADWEKEVHTERNTSNSREKNSTGWSTIQTCHQKWNNTPHNPSSSVTFTLQWSSGCVSASNHQH